MDAIEFDKQILAIVHDLRPFEKIEIIKDAFGRPGKIIVTCSKLTILDLDLTESKK